MKAIITLKVEEESTKFMEGLDLETLKKELDFVYPSKLELTIRGEFSAAYTGLSLWIENEEGTILRVPMNIIRDFAFKENK